MSSGVFPSLEPSFRVVWPGYQGVFKVATFLSDARRPEVDLLSLLSRDFEKILGQIVSIRVNTLSDTCTDLVASSHVKRVDVRTSKTSLLIYSLLFTTDRMF